MEKKLQKYIFYILQFFNRARFMASSLSNLVDNLSEGIPRRNKCKLMIENVKYVELSKYCACFLEYTNVKDDLIEYKCLSCNKCYQRKFDEKLKERFFNT